MASEALISLVVDYLIPYAQEKVTLVSSAGEQVRKLAATLKLIQRVLADAEQKQATNPAVMDWLVKLKGVVYAAEDVLDEWNTKTALLEHETGDVDSAGSTRKKVLSILLPICRCFKDVSVRYDIGGQIKELGKRLDEIAEEKGKYALVASDSHHDLRPSVTPLTTSSVNVSDILGRDRDKQIIINFLLSDSSSQGDVPFQVISVVGTGGFGKTTLARLVFKEKNVENAFDCKIWVCVSQPFDQLRIAKEIIEQTTGNVPSFHGLEVLHQHLSNAVKEKKFLLILDDVWTSDDRDWEPLKLCLSGGASGSRIVVTTRSREVAMMMGSAHIHDLRILSEEDSWSLLSHVALRGREHEHRKFEKIGREIALKCKGVPLAIKTLASLLCHKRNIKEWRDVSNNNLWEMPKIKEFFLPSLFISYYSLSPVSKQCFLFCSVFPKDTIMRKRDLVELWMANGFFGYQGNKELEKIAEHHFDTLVMCSFFQDLERDLDESIKSCQMHDLVHDFAQFLSQGECVIEDGNNGEFDANRVRHLWTRNFSDELYNANNLRTVMGSGPDIVPRIGKLVCLRTLDLRGCDFQELPSAVCKLLHLRFLVLSQNPQISELPEEICSLYNLQTLRLSDCTGLHILPERIGDLCNLRVLDIVRIRLNGLPVGLKKLIFLRRLSTFIVGESNAECKIRDLRYLNKLQGSLRIEGLGRIKDANEADQAELNKRDDIDDLTLSFTPGRTAETSNSVLQRLEPPENLKRLEIIGYPGDRFPSWMYDSTLLSSLVSIDLDDCANCTELPPLGKLESLEWLGLTHLRSVKRLGPEFFGGEDGVVTFPKLTRLYIYDMSELEEWNFVQGDVSTTTRITPNIRELWIYSCPRLTYLPYYMFQPLDALWFYDCESLDFDLKDLQQNVTLRYLRIRNCPHLEERFQGEEWRSILSHVPYITLNDVILNGATEWNDGHATTHKNRKLKSK